MKASAQPGLVPADWRALLLIFVAMLAAVAALRWHSWTEPLEADEAVYMVIAHDWTEGGQPYVTTWDNKPIGTFILHRWGIRLFGYAERTPRLMSLLATLLAGGLLLAILRRERWWQVLIGAAVWVPLTCWVPVHANGANMEVYLLPFLLGAWLLLVEGRAQSSPWPWRLAAAGLLALSLLLKPVTLPFLLIPFVLDLPKGRREWLVRLGLLAGVGSGVVVLHLAVYALAGYSPSVLGELLGVSARYAGGTGGNPVWRLLRTLVIWPWHPGLRLLLPLTVPVAVGIALRLWRGDRQRAWGELLFLGAGLTAAAISGSDHAHYYILLLPVLALSLARSTGYLAGRWRTLVPAAAAMLLFLGARTWRDYLRQVPEQLSINKYGWSWFPRDRYIGRQLRDYGVVGQRVFVTGSHPGVIFYSRAAVAHPHFVEWMVAMGVITREEIMADLRADPPPFIVRTDPQSLYPGLDAWLAADYEQVAEIVGATLWRRLTPAADDG